MTDFDDTYGCCLLYDPSYLHLQILPVVRVNHLQSAADGVAVEITGHAELGIDEKCLLDDGNGG